MLLCWQWVKPCTIKSIPCMSHTCVNIIMYTLSITGRGCTMKYTKILHKQWSGASLLSAMSENSLLLSLGSGRWLTCRRQSWAAAVHWSPWREQTWQQWQRQSGLVGTGRAGSPPGRGDTGRCEPYDPYLLKQGTDHLHVHKDICKGNFWIQIIIVKSMYSRVLSCTCNIRIVRSC